MTAVVKNVEVERATDASLVVTWQIGQPGPVDISVGTTPIASQHRHACHVPVGETSARVADPAPGHRPYVSVAGAQGEAIVGAERRLPFEGVRNFRDLGGYPTDQGTRTRWGLVYRSDELSRLTPGDLEMFKQLGTRAVFDLRGDAERKLAPDPVESVQIALLDWYTSDSGVELLKAKSLRDGEAILSHIYDGMLANCGALFSKLLSSLSAEGGLPAVFHCAGGKDRTGMAAALLLGLLGVGRETVLDDYELTKRWAANVADQPLLRVLVGVGINEQAAAGFLGAPRWVMAEALDRLDHDYGGVEAYLRNAGGMPDGTILGLRHTLTE